MKTLEFAQMLEIVDQLGNDPELQNLYATADKVSKEQTKHDVGHASAVSNTAQHIVKEINRAAPGRLSDPLCLLVVKAGAFFHDIGRAVEVNNHAQAGSVIALNYLTEKNFSTTVAARIAAIVACHRSEDFLKLPLHSLKLFPELSVVVMADKCVGDEDRVRFWRALILSILSRIGLAKVSLWKNSVHDRVNFAIKESRILVDSDDHPSRKTAGAIILKLSMKTDDASGEELLTLYNRRFQACDYAAKSLGFAYRVEVNGTRYFFNHHSAKWEQKVTYKIAIP